MRLDHVSAAKIEKNPKRKPRKRSVFKAFGLVRVTGLEPACPYEHKNLNLTCLPIPPYPHIKLKIESGKLKIVRMDEMATNFSTMHNLDFIL